MYLHPGQATVVSADRQLTLRRQAVEWRLVRRGRSNTRRPRTSTR